MSKCVVRPTDVFVLIYNMAAKTLYQRSQNQDLISFFFCSCPSVFTGFPQGKSRLGRGKLTSASSAAGDIFALLCFAVFYALL